MLVTLAELKRGCDAFERNESRDAMYRVAARLVDDLWPAMDEVTDGLGVLMLTWNQAFYRYGSFSFDALEEALKEHKATLEQYRARDVLGFDASTDEGPVRTLFRQFLVALQIDADNKKRGTQSPVAVAKALHVIAPRFFPLWDREIGVAYGCRVDDRDESYLRFTKKTIEIIDTLEREYDSGGDRAGLPDAKNLAAALSIRTRFSKPILKFLDEYNYAKFTKGWI